MPHIVSTLANSQSIVEWKKPVAANNSKTTGPATKKRSVFIQGTMGAGAAAGVSTPGGAVTRVTDEELEFLEQHPSFIAMKDRGHFKIIKKESDPAPKLIEKVANDMPTDDGEVKGENGEESAGSTQLSIANGDFEEGGRAGGLAPADEQKII